MEIKDLTISFIALQAWQYYAPENNRPYGGAELQVKLTAENLRKQFGCRVCIVTLADEDGLQSFNGVDVRTISRSHSFIKKTKLIISALAELNTDIVVQRSYGYETFFASWYARKYNKKFIYMIAHLMDTDPFKLSDLKNPRKIAYRLGLKRADIITAQTQEQFNRLKPVYQQRASLLRNIFTENVPKKSDKEGILWVGRAIEFKRPELFIKLAQKIPDLPFVMIMNKSHLEDYNNQLIEQIDSTPNLELIPYVPVEEILTYFDRAKIFVSTSTVEGFPNTFLQACCAGTPIATLLHDPDLVVEENHLGITGKGNFDAFTKKIQSLYQDSDKLEECGENCISYLKENHSPEIIMNQWETLINDLF